MVPEKSFISLPANREGRNLHTQKSKVFINPPKNVLTEPSVFLLSKHTYQDTDSQQHTNLSSRAHILGPPPPVHSSADVVLFQGSVATPAKSNLLEDPIPNLQKVKRWDN